MTGACFARFGRTLHVYRQAAVCPSCHGVRKERTKDLPAAPTGSRRFICIKVTAPVDTNVSADCRQLYAQVMTLICQGERYWLNDKDRVVLYQSSQEFGQISPLEELYRCCLSFAEKEDVGRMDYADRNVQLHADADVLQVGYQQIVFVRPYSLQAICALGTRKEGAAYHVV